MSEGPCPIDGTPVKLTGTESKRLIQETGSTGPTIKSGVCENGHQLQRAEGVDTWQVRR